MHTNFLSHTAAFGRVAGSRDPLRWRLRKATALLVLGLSLSAGLASAQPAGDEAWYRRFANNIGSAAFFFAWPTATYDHMEFGRIDPKSEGADVAVVLYGSGFPEGKIWTEVVLEIRNSDLSDLHFGRYSALNPPGSVFGNLAAAMAAYRNRHQLPSPPAQQLSVLCLSNPTSERISYVLAPSAEPQSIEANKTWMMWHAGGAEFNVSFTAVKGSGTQKTMRIKGGLLQAKPESCEPNITYDFLVDQTRVGLIPETWIPGTEHPFLPNVVRSQSESEWACTDGYKREAPGDPDDQACILKSIGLVGVTLDNAQEGQLFPKIAHVRQGSPASRANLQPGAYLVEINGVSLKGLPMDQIISRIRGPVNTTVRLGVSVPGRGPIQYYVITRE